MTANYGESNLFACNLQKSILLSKKLTFISLGGDNTLRHYPLRKKDDTYALKYRQGHSIIKPYTACNPTLTTAN